MKAKSIMGGIWSASLLILYGTKAVGAVVDLRPLADAEVVQGLPNSNFGGSSSLIVGGTGSHFNTPHRMLLQFDVAASIPFGARIQSVQLSLWDVSVSSSVVPSSFELHRVVREWGAGKQDGGLAELGEVSWNSAKAGVQNWSVGGGDFASTPSASLSVTKGGGVFRWGTTVGLVADVQGWMDQTTPNHGWILLSSAEDTLRTARRFGSAEAGSSLAPSLRIEYAPIPEPSSSVVMGASALGVFAYFRRKKRD